MVCAMSSIEVFSADYISLRRFALYKVNCVDDSVITEDSKDDLILNITQKNRTKFQN